MCGTLAVTICEHDTETLEVIARCLGECAIIVEHIGIEVLTGVPCDRIEVCAWTDLWYERTSSCVVGVDTSVDGETVGEKGDVACGRPFLRICDSASGRTVHDRSSVCYDDGINTCDRWVDVDIPSLSIRILSCDEEKCLPCASIFDIGIDLDITTFDYD